MSSLSQFVGGAGIKPKGLFNGASVGGGGWDNVIAVNNTTRGLPPSQVAFGATGALTANTLVTALSLSGQGCISLLGCSGVDSTSRTHRLKVTLDGVVIYDATSGAFLTGGVALMALGGFIPSASTFAAPIYEPLVFNTSLLVEYASSVTETAKSIVFYRYVAR